MTTPRLVVRALLAGAALALAVVPDLAAATPRRTAAPAATRPGRLLVVSLPGVTWADVATHDLPALQRFAHGAALADLAPRSVLARSGPGDAYLTISGGSRATTAPEVDGQVLGVRERSSGSAAGDIFQRRTGAEPTGPFVSLTWPTLERANAAQPYETELGSLTDTLRTGGVSAAAIGNADGIDSVGDSYERQAGLALADSTGTVPGGSLGKDLLQEAPAEPFGVRLDPAIVGSRFRRAWAAAAPRGERQGGVVLVEASDLARTLRYRPIVDRERYDALWSTSLAHTDQLFAQLLQSVDLRTDTVLVVAPYNLRGDRDLTMVALRGPRAGAGYLRSASTQRAGFLTLVDIAPTILDQFGVDRPVKMEGRPAVVERSSDSGPARVRHLVDLNASSRFREQLLTPTTILVVLLFAAVAALAIAAHANRWGPRARAAIWFAALVDLAVLPASYLTRVFELEQHGIGFYWAVLLAISLGFPAAAALVGRRRNTWRGPLIAVLALMALVLAGDVISGSHLSLSAAFGYSASGNSRLYGISNYSYGQLAAATCLLAAWLAGCRAGGRGSALGIGAMVATLVVLGVPTWGSDVGGVLAFTPAVAVFAVRITGRTVKLRTLAIGAASTALAIAVFGLLDLSRPASSRGHLGRLFERIGSEGPAPVLSLVQRKLAANLEVSTSSLWVLAIPVALAFWVYLRRFPDRPYQGIVERFPTLRAGLAAALVAGVLGSALNDSGAIIGGVMATVVGASLAALLVEGPSAPRSEPVRAHDPDPR